MFLLRPPTNIIFQLTQLLKALLVISGFIFFTRIEKRPKKDGKLSEPCWEFCIWYSVFIQQAPNQLKKPLQETEIKILYDDNNLYVGFKCFDIGP